MSNSFKIRNFIKAKSEKRLRSLMLHKQLELKMAALAFDIVYAKGFWFAWYYEIAKDETVMQVGSDIDDTAKND